MGDDRVSDISAGAGKVVGGMVNGIGPTLRSKLQGWEPVGVAVLLGQRLISTMS